MKIAFNTGRLYTEAGQPITIELVGDNAVFVDHARGIDGMVTIRNKHMFDTPRSLAAWVMQCYDHGQYGHVPAYPADADWKVAREPNTTEEHKAVRRMQAGYAAFIAAGATEIDRRLAPN